MAKSKLPQTLVAVILSLLKRRIGQSCDPEPFLKYLRDNLPNAIVSRLLSLFIQDPMCDPDLQFAGLRTLFNEQCRSLKFSFTDKRYYSDIVQLFQGENLKLEELNLHGVWLQKDTKVEFITAISRLGNLTQLCVPHIADNQLMRVVAQSCPRLRHLDVSGTSSVTQRGLSYIYHESSVMRESLLFLDLGGALGDALDSSSVGEVVNYSPNLASLGAYPFTLKAIHYLWDNYEESEPLALRYLHDRNTNEIMLHSSRGLIPGIRACYLDTPEASALAHLPRFTHLNKLKLSRVDASDIHALLGQLPRLRVLELVCARGHLDLAEVGRALASLDTLEIYYSDHVHTSSQNVVFAALKKLVIYSTESHLCAKPLLKTCPKLENVTLCDCSDITDEELFDLIDSGCLQACQEIYWLNAPMLSVQSVWTLITLPRVSVIGKLDEWSLSPFEANELEEEIKFYNLGVKLYGKPKGTFVFENIVLADVY